MKEHRYKNLEGRNKLIEKLTQEYITASASEATIILGNHGSGKSHVVFEVINRIHSNIYLQFVILSIFAMYSIDNFKYYM